VGHSDYWHALSPLQRRNGRRDLDVPDRYRRHDFQHAVNRRNGKHCTYSVRSRPSTAVHGESLTRKHFSVVASIIGSASSHPPSTSNFSPTSRAGFQCKNCTGRTTKQRLIDGRLGWQTALVSTAYSAALAVQGMIALNVPGYTVPSWHGVILTIGAVLFTIIFNTALLRKLPTLEGGMLVLHVFAFIAIFTILWVMGDRAPASEVFTEWSDPQGWGSVQLPHLLSHIHPLTRRLAVWCSNLYRIVIGHRFFTWQRQRWYVGASESQGKS
jgi:hypothetical protein